MLKREFFPDRHAFAPIDAKALDRYRFFKKLGFFGVEPGSRRGAVAFMQTATSISADSKSVLWLTPQARFRDIRERPPRFAAGLGHLAARQPHLAFVPLAIEYVFWEERLPEVLVRFGEPIKPSASALAGLSATDWTSKLEAALAHAQDRLAEASLERDPARFRVLAKGRSGVGAVYDWWCALRARVSGQSHRWEHGDK
jgi:hypothetical protein